MMKKTVVIGASTNSDRYSYMATVSLLRHGHEVVPIGLKEGQIESVNILTGMPAVSDVHSVTMYINPQRQPEYYDYILSLKPKRIIFNPGTANPELMQLCAANNIEVTEACTLVLLSGNLY